VARFRPSSDNGRGPLSRNNRSESKLSSRSSGPAACALEERSPRHSSALGGGRTAPPLPKGRGARRNRRAPGASAGGKFDGDGCLHPDPAGFPPVGGDRQIADLFRRQSTVRPIRFGKIFLAYLRYLRYLWANCDGWATLRCLLCGFLGALGVLVVRPQLSKSPAAVMASLSGWRWVRMASIT